MAKVIELRPNRSLINQNFEKYQFSSEPVTINPPRGLLKDVYRQEPGSSQDSWLEARLFAFHNHLFKNPFDESVWFIDERRDVWRLNRYCNIAPFRKHSDSATEQSDFRYNPSMAFASAKIVALTNGGNTLEVILENYWVGKQSFVIDDIESGVILDARYVKEKSLIIVAICCISEDSGKKCCKLVLLYCKLKSDKVSDDNTLELQRKQVLNVKGPIEYVYIEASGDYVHMISQDRATFEFDSSKPVEEKSSETNDSTEERIPKYYWSQDEDTITVSVKVPKKYQNEPEKIRVTASNISIEIKDTVLIQGDSQHRLDPDLMTSKREKDVVRVELKKFESGLMWNELIKGDTDGEWLPNASLAAEVHNRLSHLCTSEPLSGAGEGQPVVGFNAEQLEECDLEGSDNYLQRINLDEHSITHLAMLGSSNHVLFTHKLKSGQVLCLRHDHHGIVWKPEEKESNEWEIQHVDTFPGFGYVEASKTNKKFCVSPPNGAYVAIVEHTRQIFLYEKTEGPRPVAKQRIVDLGPGSSPIMGVASMDKDLIILTKDKLYDINLYH